MMMCRVWMDAHVSLVSVTDVSASQWDVAIHSPHPPVLYTRFIARSRHSSLTWDDYVFALLIRSSLNGNASKTAALNWEVSISNSSTASSTQSVWSPSSSASTHFALSAHAVHSLVIISQTRSIVNTAVLSGGSVSVWMRVFAVSEGGTVSDVSSQCTCSSSEPRVLKVSPSCASVLVDGSELRGLPSVTVTAVLEGKKGQTTFTVWFPRIPLSVWIRDPVMNVIADWPVRREAELGAKGKSSARQHTCSNRFQQTQVRILASFFVTEEETGERVFLSQSADVLFDVTSLAGDRVQTDDGRVAWVKRDKHSLTLIPLSTGSTNVVVKTTRREFHLGASPIIVTAEEVRVRSISAHAATNISLSLAPSSDHFVLATAIASSTFTHPLHRAWVSVWVHYSDEQKELLDNLSATDYSIQLHSSDESALIASPPNLLTCISSSPQVEVSIEVSASPSCSLPSLPFISTSIPLSIHFSPTHSTTRIVPSESSLPSDLHVHGWKWHTVIALFFICCILLIAFRMLSARSSPLSGCAWLRHDKLMAPLLSRFSSLTTEGRREQEEEEKEWVWMSKSNTISQQHRPNSNDSQSHGSYDYDTHNSTSYRGSEISVFISAQPAVTVNGTMADRQSWRAVHSQRSKRSSAMVGSSSGELANVHPADFDRSPTHTWTACKRHTPPRYRALRESIA